MRVDHGSRNKSAIVVRVFQFAVVVGGIIAAGLIVTAHPVTGLVLVISVGLLAVLVRACARGGRGRAAAPAVETPAR